MYHGLKFSNTTFGVCLGAFLLFYVLFTGVKQWERNMVEGSRVEMLTVDLKVERLHRERLERENHDLRQPVDSRGRRLTEDELEALVRLAWKESRWHPLDQNPESTAFGTWQFLDSTWKGTKIRKTSDPYLQTVAALRYIKSRYGSPTNALAFHRRRNYY